MATPEIRARDPLLDRLFAILNDADAGAEDDAEALLGLAQVHGIQPLVATKLGSERTRAILQDAAARNTRRLRDFATAVNALHARGIEVVALKGVHLLSLVYRNLAARHMTDLDLLIPKTRLQDAAEVMRELGYDFAQPFHLVPDDPIPYFSYQLPSAIKPGKTTIDVHWHVHKPRPSASMNVDELWERAQPARIAGVDVRVLAPEDLLLHVAHHAAYAHRCELSARACCDVAEIIAKQALDWDALIDRARRWTMEPGAYLLLRLARELRNANVPDRVLAALRPAHFDERLLHVALRGEEGQKLAVHRLHYARGVRGKLKTIRDFWFIGRNEIADLYGVKRSSPLVYGLYLIRPFRFLKRLPGVAASFRKDGGTASDMAIIDSFLGDSIR